MTVHAQAGPDPTRAEPPHLREAAADVLGSLRSQVSALLELGTLEVRYSGLMLASALALGLIAALATFTAWGLLVAAGVSALISLGWSLWLALLVVALANLLVVAVSVWLLLKSISRVGMDATRQAMGLGDPHAD